VLVSCDHDFVQLLFASGDTRPSVILVREVDALPSAALAALLLAALPGELTELLLAGAIATLTPDRVRVRPLPLRPRAPRNLSPTHSRRPARGSPLVIDDPLCALRRHDAQPIVQRSAVHRLSVDCRTSPARLSRWSSRSGGSHFRRSAPPLARLHPRSDRAAVVPLACDFRA
jgi:hypothetical protein